MPSNLKLPAGGLKSSCVLRLDKNCVLCIKQLCKGCNWDIMAGQGGQGLTWGSVTYSRFNHGPEKIQCGSCCTIRATVIIWAIIHKNTSGCIMLEVALFQWSMVQCFGLNLNLVLGSSNILL